jgi:GT2 family glycosyltransferase
LTAKETGADAVATRDLVTDAEDQAGAAAEITMCQSSTPTPDVTVSIVSFNTRDLLRACLQSLAATVGVSYEVLVVDNGSSDGSPKMVAQEFPQVHLLAGRENRGFAAANNLAILRARGRFVLLLNPDTVVFPRTIAGMTSFLDTHEDVGICGPRILFPDRVFQSCGYNFPTPLSEVRMSKNVGKLLRLVVGEEPAPPSGSTPYECDWVDGACLMVRKAVINRIGPLDEQYFLFTEELDWCFSARKVGWKVYALPHVEMLHYRGKSSEQASDRSLALLVETKLRYFHKNHGLPTALFVSVVNAAGFLKQMRQDPQKNRAKLRGVRQFWASLRASGRRRPEGSGDQPPGGNR